MTLIHQALTEDVRCQKMPKLIVMIGESGSGKSTRAKEILEQGQKEGRNIVRVNMDNIREMLFGKDSSWDLRLKPVNAKLVTKLEQQAVNLGLYGGYDVIVDDINLSQRTQQKWETLVHELNYDRENEIEFEIVRMDTPFEECIRRDNLRTGREHVGRAVIERQFLTSGRADFGNKPIILCDIDGTLANSDGIRSPYDESKVFLDAPYFVICSWLDELAKDHTIVLVSGRHASCGPDTIKWLEYFVVPYDHLLMRNSGDNRPDTVVKQELLEGMYKCGVTKDQIKFVLDDRPKVIDMWRSNGLTVYPVRGQVEEF